MITTADIKKLKENFVTKEEFHAGVSELRTELKSDILSFKDAILHEILAMRQELQIIIGYRDQIEDHETRIQKLEKIIR